MITRLFRSAVVIFLAASLVSGAPVYGQSQGQTQNQPQEPSQAQPQSQAQNQPYNLAAGGSRDFSKGKPAFPNLLAPYAPIKLEQPILTNSARIDQLIKEGKLMLTLQDAIALALENNLDISVQRFIPWIAETDELRTKAGGVARGLGGTGTASALGAIPQSSFDPVITTSFNWSRSHFPVNNALTSGAGTTPQLAALTVYNQNANVQYSQGFHTGTALALALDNTRNSTSSTFNFFNPSVQSTFVLQFQQQLLNGFGLLPNTRFILEAKNNKKVADLSFSSQVMTSVSQVQNLYWELVFARENVKVRQAALTTSEKLYGDNKRQVEIGTLAPIEVVRAESEVATDRQNLIVAQTALLQQQTLLLNAITKNPIGAGLLDLEIVPTDAITSPQVEALPLQDAVKEAWDKRPEVRQAELNLKNAGIEVRATRNALLPQLTAFGQYSSTGLAGNHLMTVSPATPTVISGVGNSLGTAFSTDFPQYSAGVNFTLPVRNRSAQADSARALLDERQLETSYRQLQNSIAVDVRNAQIALQQDVARVEAAQKARELAQQTLDAEEKKYQLGASTIFFVIQAQRDLTTAQGNELRAKVDLTEARVAFDKSLGRTLEVNHITVADAKAGHVYHDPLIPGTPTFEVIGGAGKY